MYKLFIMKYYNKLNKNFLRIKSLLNLSSHSEKYKDFKKPQNIFQWLFYNKIILENIDIENENLQIIEDSFKSITSDLTKQQKISQEPFNKVIKDLMMFRDRLLIKQYNASDSNLSLINSIYEEVGKILELNGVYPIEKCDYFNEKYHMIIEVVKTKEQKMDKMIQEIVRPGYKDKEKNIIRLEEVIVYKYQEEEEN